MKNYLKLIVLAGLSGMLFITSCQKEDDPETTDARDKFIGTWKCTESGPNSNPTPYTINIQKSGSSAIEISNFAALGTVSANVSGSAFSVGQYNFSGQILTNGAGSYQNEKINISYTLNGDPVNGVCEKQ